MIQVKLWFLAFLFAGQPMVSGPFELDVCLYLAQQQVKETGAKAHCYRPPNQREYPNMTKDYLPARPE